MIKVREVRIAKEVKRSDGWWRFACGDVFIMGSLGHQSVSVQTKSNSGSTTGLCTLLLQLRPNRVHILLGLLLTYLFPINAIDEGCPRAMMISTLEFCKSFFSFISLEYGKEQTCLSVRVCVCVTKRPRLLHTIHRQIEQKKIHLTSIYWKFCPCEVCSSLPCASEVRTEH